MQVPPAPTHVEGRRRQTRAKEPVAVLRVAPAPVLGEARVPTAHLPEAGGGEEVEDRAADETVRDMATGDDRLGWVVADPPSPAQGEMVDAARPRDLDRAPGRRSRRPAPRRPRRRSSGRSPGKASSTRFLEMPTPSRSAEWISGTPHSSQKRTVSGVGAVQRDEQREARVPLAEAGEVRQVAPQVARPFAGRDRDQSAVLGLPLSFTRSRGTRSCGHMLPRQAREPPRRPPGRTCARRASRCPASPGGRHPENARVAPARRPANEAQVVVDDAVRSAKPVPTRMLWKKISSGAKVCSW